MLWSFSSEAHPRKARAIPEYLRDLFTGHSSFTVLSYSRESNNNSVVYVLALCHRSVVSWDPSIHPSRPLESTQSSFLARRRK